MDPSCFGLAGGAGAHRDGTMRQTGQDHVQWIEAIARPVDGLRSANDSIRSWVRHPALPYSGNYRAIFEFGRQTGRQADRQPLPAMARAVVSNCPDCPDCQIAQGYVGSRIVRIRWASGRAVGMSLASDHKPAQGSLVRRRAQVPSGVRLRS